MNLAGKKAYLPFKGGSTYGIGFIRKTSKEKDFGNMHEYVFECKSGSIYFNKTTENQVRGIQILLDPEEIV